MTAMAALVGCVDNLSRLTSGALTSGAGVLQPRSGGVLRGSQPPLPPQPAAAVVAALSARSSPVPASPSASCSSSTSVSRRRARMLSAASSPYTGGGFCTETLRAATTLARGSSSSAGPMGAKRADRAGGASVSRAGITASLQAVEELPPSLQTIVKGFQAVPDPMARYQQLLYYATKLEPLPADLHLAQYKVRGCVSQVWVVPTLREDGTVHFRADSDSALTKGLAALLVGGLNGSRPEDIIRISPDFIELLGLKQKLTPSRNNGFLNMLKTMQKLTLELYMEEQARKTAGPRDDDGTTSGAGDMAREGKGSAANVQQENGSGGLGGEQQGEKKPEREKTSGAVEREVVPQQQVVVVAAAVESAASTSGRPVFESMKRKIEASLRPSLLEIEDQSSDHAGHAGVASSPAKETHFILKVVSEEFEGKSSVKRHRLIYDLLDEEFAKGLHALSLITKAPSEV